MRVLVNALALASLDGDDLDSRRSGSSLFLGQGKRTDGSVRADISTLVALNAGIVDSSCGTVTATPRFS